MLVTGLNMYTLHKYWCHQPHRRILIVKIHCYVDIPSSFHIHSYHKSCRLKSCNDNNDEVLLGVEKYLFLQ